MSQNIGKSWVAKTIQALFALCVGAAVYVAYHRGTNTVGPIGLGPLVGENTLEKALRVGTSSKADMDEFKVQGGLDKTSLWHGFRVRSVRTVHHPSGLLAFAELTLYKSGMLSKVASAAELRSAMTAECGPHWNINTDMGAVSLQQKNPQTGIECSTLETTGGGADTVVVVLAKPKDGAAAAPSAAVDPQPDRSANDPETVVKTAGGILRVVADQSEQPPHLTLNNRLVAGTEGGDFQEIKQTFHLGLNDIVLVMKGNTGTCCNTFSELYFVTVTPAGEATASTGKDSVPIESGEDGSAEVEVSGDQLSVTTVTANGRRQKTHRYVFANGKVTVSK